MKTSLLLCLALVSLTLSASPARADNYWSEVGAQCNVDETSELNALHLRASGGIKFASGKTGTIGMFCSVSKNSGASLLPNRLIVTYQDTDYTTASTRVLARLFRMPRFSSSIGITQIGTDITSASPQIASTSDNWMYRAISHPFDFENYFYFVYVELARTSTAQQAILYGVALDYVVP